MTLRGYLEVGEGVRFSASRIPASASAAGPAGAAIQSTR